MLMTQSVNFVNLKSMKKLSAFLLVLLTSGMLFAASLRDYVCIVRPDVSEKTTAFLTEYKDYLLSKGYKNYSSNIESYLKGSFGSGFVIYGSDNKPYILTNRHVVTESETVTVQFENSDGSVSEYKNLKVIACDEDIDVALIKLPDGFSKSGLTLWYGKVNDGDDVWSAGFPGLGTDPVWQLGKGIVSNSSARIKELLDPSISTLIQHSAQIDAGNSGGPLMVASSKNSAGYVVIGINTWKAVYRENTNYAIPASCIKNFMDKAISGKGKVNLSERLSQFSKTVANKDATFTDMSRFISNDMVATCGGELFLKVLQKASTDVRSKVINAFAYNPIEGLRYTLSYYVYSAFQKDGAVIDYKTSDPELSGAFYKVDYTPAEGDVIPAVWMEEQGNWKLQNFNNLATKSEDESDKTKKASDKKNSKEKYGSAAVTMEDPYELGITGGYILPKDGKGGFTVDLVYGFQYFGINIFLMQETAPLIVYDTVKPTSMFTYGGGARIQLPINFAYVILEPYAEVKAGMSNLTKIFDDTDRFYFGACAGIDFIVNAWSDDIAPVIGVKYMYSTYKEAKQNRFAVTAGLKLKAGLY